MPGPYWSICLTTRAWKNGLYRLPPKKDYHVYIARSTYHYAYARQTQVDWKKKQRKEKKMKERKENTRKRKNEKVHDTEYRVPEGINTCPICLGHHTTVCRNSNTSTGTPSRTRYQVSYTPGITTTAALHRTSTAVVRAALVDFRGTLVLSGMCITGVRF